MENLQTSNKETEGEKKKRTRTVREYPVQLFEESFKFSESIYQFGVGQKVRKLKLFDHLGKSPESGTSRALIINSNKYGLINGSINSEFLELTSKALQSFKEEISQYFI